MTAALVVKYARLACHDWIYQEVMASEHGWLSATIFSQRPVLPRMITGESSELRWINNVTSIMPDIVVSVQ